MDRYFQGIFTILSLVNPVICGALFSQAVAGKPARAKIADATRAAVSVPIIITEVLHGFRTDSGFQRARRVLLALPVIQPTVGCHVRAAHLFRSLRQKGITVRGAVDCIIAQTCLDVDAELLSPDADFERIALHTPLRLWEEVSG